MSVMGFDSGASLSGRAPNSAVALVEAFSAACPGGFGLGGTQKP